MDRVLIEDFVKRVIPSLKQDIKGMLNNSIPNKQNEPVIILRSNSLFKNKNNNSNIDDININEYAVIFLIIEGIADYLENMSLIEINNDGIVFSTKQPEFKFQKKLIEDLRILLKATAKVKNKREVILNRIMEVKYSIEDEKEWNEVADFFISLELYYLYLKEWSNNRIIKKHHKRVEKIFEEMREKLGIKVTNKVFLNSASIAKKIFNQFFKKSSKL